MCLALQAKVTTAQSASSKPSGGFRSFASRLRVKRDSSPSVKYGIVRIWTSSMPYTAIKRRAARHDLVWEDMLSYCLNPQSLKRLMVHSGIFSTPSPRMALTGMAASFPRHAFFIPLG